jgi:hypothetical protein
MTSTSRIIRHRLPVCRATGLDRYRDRHQARHGAAALCTSDRAFKLTTFACPKCRGFHLEKLRRHRLRTVGRAVAAPGMASAPRRYVLVDIENLVAGHATRSEVRALWRVLAQEAPGITANDHVVIGGNRYVAKKFSTTIGGDNIKWVVGAGGPDGADRALLAATKVHQIAKRYDDLIIMSGDHAFTELAVLARRLGLRIHVVTTKRRNGRPSLSRQLAAAADLNTTVLFGRADPRTANTGRSARRH